KPFTIQLLDGSSGYKQEVKIGVDLGAKHVGIAMTSQNKVLAKGEIELRQDVKGLLETRRTDRRSRRHRKTRYRKPRFENRPLPDGWLPSSRQCGIDHTFFWIDRSCAVVPNPRLIIEIGKFDAQKMVSPAIQGVDYQQAQTSGDHDVRYFVFAR